MSLTVTQRPLISYGGDYSTWNAVRNPLVYRMQRRDYTYNQVNNSGGVAQLQFTGVNITSSFVVGNSVYTSTNSFATVTASIFSGGNTLVTLSVAYTAATGGYVNNLSTRTLYMVEVEVYNLANELLNEDPFSYTPDSQGNLLIDVSPILKASLIDDIDFLLTGTTEVFDDTNVYTGFYIKYREVWTGSAEAQTDDVANQFYATLSALQIPSAYGGNLALYAFPVVKYLTKFTSPVMWRGYPFLLSAIINEDISSDVYIASADDNSVPDDYSGKQIAFDLNQIIADQTVDEVEMTIHEDTSGEDPVSEQITVELRDACEEPIMLVGRNSLGGILQWLFDINQEYTHDYGDGVKAKRMKLFADDLTINQWEGLQDFFGLGEVYRNNIIEFTSSTNKTSTRIGQQVYAVDSTGNKIGVIVIPRAPVTETKQVRHSFEIEIEYPEIFA